MGRRWEGEVTGICWDRREVIWCDRVEDEGSCLDREQKGIRCDRVEDEGTCWDWGEEGSRCDRVEDEGRYLD